MAKKSNKTRARRRNNYDAKSQDVMGSVRDISKGSFERLLNLKSRHDNSS